MARNLLPNDRPEPGDRRTTDHVTDAGSSRPDEEPEQLPDDRALATELGEFDLEPPPRLLRRARPVEEP